MQITTSPSRAISWMASGIVGDVVHEHRLHLAGHPNGARQRTAIGGHDGRLAGRIDLGQQHRVGVADHLDEILEAVARARVAVRLERQHQAAAGEGAARGRQRGGNLDRVMAVVLDHRELAATVRGPHRNIAIALEAPAHALELGQGLAHRLVGDVEFHGDGDGRQRIEHVVMACEVELDLKVGQGHAVAPLHREVHLLAHGADVDGPHLGLLADAIAGHRALHVGHDFAYRRVVDAEDRRAIEGHAMQEFQEGALELAEVVPIGFHVVGVDVGHHRHHRHQVQERCIGLVGLDHDVVAAAELGVRARAVQAPADDESGVQPALGQHAGHQAGGRRLAVRAGDRDALLQAHQLGQHHRARHDGNHALAGGEHLGVVGLHCRGRDHRVGADDVAVRVAHVGLDAQRLQAAQRRAVVQVRAGDLVALVAQHLGDAGHAGAADADEMNVFDGVFHVISWPTLRKPRPLRPWR